MVDVHPPEVVFKVLGDAARLRLIALFVHMKQALCVCEIVDALDIPQYQVSRNMRHLKDAGLVCVRKSGTWAYYYLNIEVRFNRQLFDFLDRTLQSEVYAEDRRLMRARLAFRDQGHCKIGRVPNAQLRQMVTD